MDKSKVHVSLPVIGPFIVIEREAIADDSDKISLIYQVEISGTVIRQIIEGWATGIADTPSDHDLNMLTGALSKFRLSLKETYEICILFGRVFSKVITKRPKRHIDD